MQSHVNYENICTYTCVLIKILFRQNVLSMGPKCVNYIRSHSVSAEKFYLQPIYVKSGKQNTIKGDFKWI